MLDEKWMRLALDEARKAFENGEVPVGAVIVKDGQCISLAHNRCERDHDATAHAERLAIEQACRALGTWRLTGCTMYVTLEPCPMCAGAAVNARISEIVYGAKDARAGAFGSLLDLSTLPLEHRPRVRFGLMESESRALLKDFFSRMRQNTDTP